MSITPEQARERADAELRALYATVTTWDTAVFDQVVLCLDALGEPFGMNQIRLRVPEDACRRAGLYFHALLGHDNVRASEQQFLVKVGEEVSINEKARGKKVNTYRLTPAGRRHIQNRQQARAKAARELRNARTKAARAPRSAA